MSVNNDDFSFSSDLSFSVDTDSEKDSRTSSPGRGEDCVDVRLGDVAQKNFKGLRVGIIQNNKEDHTYGNYLKATFEGSVISSSVFTSEILAKSGKKLSYSKRMDLQNEIKQIADSILGTEIPFSQAIASRASVTGEDGNPIYPELYKLKEAEPNLIRDTSEAVTKYDYNPTDVDDGLMNAEVDFIIENLDKGSDKPVAQVLVEMADLKDNESGDYLYPQLHNMKEISKTVVLENHAILLPGGSSIHPKFYGETLTGSESGDEASYRSSNRRSVMEFFIINQCETQGKPLLGICRGHQSINIYHGGTLKRSVTNQGGRVRSLGSLEKEHKGILGSSPASGYFQHSQVVNKVGKGLESIVKMFAVLDLQKENALINEEANLMKGMLEEFDPYDSSGQLRGLHEKVAIDKKQVENVLDFLEEEHVALAVENEIGVPIIGCQFHPEHAHTDGGSGRSTPDTDGELSIADERRIDMVGNSLIIRRFVEMASTVENKQAVLDEIRELRGLRDERSAVLENKQDGLSEIRELKELRDERNTVLENKKSFLDKIKDGRIDK
jgi:gamma-glutamyl-gamma-aminobutyrate hydrolase PuuD